MVTVVNSSFYLTWGAPFSEDIVGVDPNIEGYCVDVTSSTSSSHLFHSECGINQTEYRYDSSGNLCDPVYFIITPVNVVGNGTQITIIAFHETGMLSVCIIIHSHLISVTAN